MRQFQKDSQQGYISPTLGLKMCTDYLPRMLHFPWGKQAAIHLSLLPQMYRKVIITCKITIASNFLHVYIVYIPNAPIVILNLRKGDHMSAFGNCDGIKDRINFLGTP